ncbi:MAG: site-specific integrase [Planctomycetota bacterium]|nr:site-specific integrase [Planctomycetota bacterium]
MPRLTKSFPTYRRHKASGRALVTLNGTDFYLGSYGSPESKSEYQRLIAEYLAANRHHPQAAGSPGTGANAGSVNGITVNEVFLRYWEHVQTYYVKHGEPTSEQHLIKLAMRPMTALYGTTPAAQFAPTALTAYRNCLVRKNLSRGVVNQHVSRVKRMFKWACRQGLFEASVYYNLACVEGFRVGRSPARETEPVRPVPEATVEAVLKDAPKHLAAMIQLQKLTAMRPEEVTLLRTCDINTTGKVWTYRPWRHKTEHRNRKRVIYLGPRAQEVLKPFLKPDLQAYLFNPREIEAARHAQRRASRVSPMTPSQRARCRKTRPVRSPKDHYTTLTYRTAIHRLCDRVFPAPEPLRRRAKETRQQWKARLTAQERQQFKVWQKEHRWHPNQLRHNAATEIRKEFGIEAACMVLGHSSAAVTEMYAEMNYAKSAEIMAKIG